MKNKKLISIFASITLSFVVVLSVACSSSNKVEVGKFPNAVCENATVEPQYKEAAQEMTDFSIDEFMNNIAKVPRPSGSVEKIRQYLIDWGHKHNLTTTLDKSGCVLYDIPATEGCENYPKVILQAHIDMVATANDSSIDMYSQPIQMVMDQDTGAIHSKDYLTNIGADDAEGMTAMMALSINNKYKHGPLRMLFTYDEETDQQGAKSVGTNVLDADYLINIDCGPVGTVIVTSAGVLRSTLVKNYQESNVGLNTQLSVKINNLLGGHSGVDIQKNRLSANVLISNILKKLTDENISFSLESCNGGNAANAIARSGNLNILINKEDIDKCSDLINKVFNDLKSQHKEENAKINIDINWSEKQSSLSFADTKEVVGIINEIPHGVREMDKQHPDTPAISSNFATLSYENGSFEITCHSRSEEDYGLDDYDNCFKDISNKYGVNYKVVNRYSGWPYAEDQRLTQLVKKSYADLCHIEMTEYVVHGGLECSRFLKIKPSIHMMCLGMDVDQEHAVQETLYTKSMPVFFAGLIKSLENVNTLN